MSKDAKPFSSCGGIMGGITWASNTPTLPLKKDVFGINDIFVSSYLVSIGNSESGKPEYIAMDTGNDPQTLIEFLEKMQIGADQIKAVFLTHAHGDHTGGIGVYSKAKVYISEEEKDYVKSENNDQVDLEYEEVLNFETLKPGEIITLNETKIEAFKNPGHTPGSVSYFINDRYLFAGAALNFDMNQKAEHQMYTLNEDHELLKESNLKLAKLLIEKGVESVFTTHGGYSDNPKAAFSDWIKD